LSSKFLSNFDSTNNKKRKKIFKKKNIFPFNINLSPRPPLLKLLLSQQPPPPPLKVSLPPKTTTTNNTIEFQMKTSTADSTSDIIYNSFNKTTKTSSSTPTQTLTHATTTPTTISTVTTKNNINNLINKYELNKTKNSDVNLKKLFNNTSDDISNCNYNNIIKLKRKNIIFYYLVLPFRRKSKSNQYELM